MVPRRGECILAVVRTWRDTYQGPGVVVMGDDGVVASLCVVIVG